MLIGEVSADKQVIITISLQDEGETLHDVRCVLDTGFLGHLTLSASAVAMLQLPYIDTIRVLLTGIKPQRVRQYEAVVEW